MARRLLKAQRHKDENGIPVRESLTIEIGGIKLSTDDIKFEYQAAPNQMIDVTLYINGVNDNNRDDNLRGLYSS